MKNNKIITVYFDEKTFENITKIAKQKNISKSKLIRDLLIMEEVKKNPYIHNYYNDENGILRESK